MNSNRNHCGNATTPAVPPSLTHQVRIHSGCWVLGEILGPITPVFANYSSFASSSAPVHRVSRLPSPCLPQPPVILDMFAISLSTATPAFRSSNSSLIDSYCFSVMRDTTNEQGMCDTVYWAVRDTGVPINSFL